MSPLCAAGELESPGPVVEGRTSYLALIQLGMLPDGRTLVPMTSGDGTVMVHGVHGDDGSLGVMVVDLRDPTTAEPVPVQISAPNGLPSDATQSWELVEGSRLSGESLTAQESTLTAPAPVAGEFADATLGRAQPLTVTSDPGTTTLLLLNPAGQAAASDGGGT